MLLGDASYSIYLLHPFALRPLSKVWTIVVGSHLPPMMFSLVGLPVALALSLGFYAFAERPIVDFFHRRRKTHSPMAANTITKPKAI